MSVQFAAARYKFRLMHSLVPALFLLPLGAAPLKAQPTLLPPVSAPQRLSARPGDGTVSLAWGRVAGAEAYRVLYASDPDGPYVQAAEIHVPRYAARGLTNWVPHYYAIAAVRHGLEGTSSRPIKVTPDGPPAAPQGLHAYRGHTQASLTWEPVPGADGYAIYRSRDADPKTTTAPIAVGVASCVWTDSGLTDGVTYYYRVAARISAELRATLSVRSAHPVALACPASSAATVTPANDLPLTPASLEAASGDGRVTLTWPGAVRLAATTPPDVTYRVYRGTRSGGEGPKPIQTGLSSASLTGDGLTNGIKYYYLVTAVNAAGESAFSSERSATPDVPGVAVASVPADGGATSGGADFAGTQSPIGGPVPGGGATADNSASPSTAVGNTPAAMNTAGLGQAAPPGQVPTPTRPTPPKPAPPTAVSAPTPAPVPSPTGGVGTTIGGSPPVTGGGGTATGDGDTSPGSPGGDVPGPPPGANKNFYFTLSSSEVRLVSGQTTTVTVTFASAFGSLGPIRPTLGPLPPGVSAFFYPASPALLAVVDGHTVATATLYLSCADSLPLPVKVPVRAALNGALPTSQTLALDFSAQ